MILETPLLSMDEKTIAINIIQLATNSDEEKTRNVAARALLIPEVAQN